MKNDENSIEQFVAPNFNHLVYLEIFKLHYILDAVSFL